MKEGERCRVPMYRFRSSGSFFFVSHLNLVVRETVQIPWICQAQVSPYSNDNVLRAKEKEEVRRSLVTSTEK